MRIQAGEREDRESTLGPRENTTCWSMAKVTLGLLVDMDDMTIKVPLRKRRTCDSGWQDGHQNEERSQFGTSCRWPEAALRGYQNRARIVVRLQTSVVSKSTSTWEGDERR